jgi:DNA-3-methyladenine glycosylase I
MKSRIQKPKPHIDDGRTRCKWAATDPMLAGYHDLEWGQPIHTDAGHLERMALEVFQCGLSWKIVLVKRPAFRKLFEGFKLQRVASFSSKDVARLTSDPSIIRNRAKIEAIVHNAGVFVDLADKHGSYRKWLATLGADTPKQRAALYPLFRETFKFMGPETTKCYLMGVGKIDAAHDRNCFANKI